MRTVGSQRTPFTTKIRIKNRQGQVIEEKEVPTFAGLLNRAHDEGLRKIVSTVVQAPNPGNGMTAIVIATVTTNRGSFTSIGDANAENVNVKIAPHFIRMADTRAKARALRDALNIGGVALEELSGNIDEEITAAGMTTPTPVPVHQRPAQHANDNDRPAQGNGGTSIASSSRGEPVFVPMSDAQRGRLFRIATARGVAPENAKHWLEAELGVPDLRALSRSTASQAIDRLENGKPNGGPSGNGAHAPTGASS